MPRYNPATIEPKWQQYWEERAIFRTPELPQGPKLYVLDMFPYPSGAGLHVGHPEGYTATDIVCRFQRMRGRSVLHPMGFDAFGLPAEEHAIRTNTPPAISTEQNIRNFTRQLKMLGFSYDWDRVLATTDRSYVRWTQWIFLVLFDTWYDPQQRRGRSIGELPIPRAIEEQGELAVARYQDQHRLAYQNDALVNWCPNLGTVLANEEVIDGRSEVGGHPVQRLPLRQWMLRITTYADRLLGDLDSLDWSPGVKKLQSDWIGRSSGAEVDFYLGETLSFTGWSAARKVSGVPGEAGQDCLRVYTTRPDTLYGATYMVVAPEHPLVPKLTTADRRAEVERYCQQAGFKSDRDRADATREKTGVFTGSYAINPANGQPIPIWVADYVLAGYGTGAIMAVPGHDERDHEFAERFHLPILQVVAPENREGVSDSWSDCFTGHGIAINSGPLDGLPTDQAKLRIVERLEESGLARPAVNYKLRDWLFSRQRFWGEPFPILHELGDDDQPTGRVVPVPDEELPVDLPQLDDYQPHGRPEPLLAKAPDSWQIVERNGKRYRRELNTMPQWAGSCWYYLRFIDPKNEACFVDPEKEKAWMPVDLYVGGAEHAVLHLLYARFWHKVLYDRGLVSTPEPFQRLVNQGMILGQVEYTALRRTDGSWVSFELGRRDSESGSWLGPNGEPLEAVHPSETDVMKSGDQFVLKDAAEIRVDSRAHKMSKSRGNVVNPDDIVREYGADSLRLYEMFMGPLEATKPWSMQGVGGVRNFLDRCWRLLIDDRAEQVQLSAAVVDVAPDAEQNRVIHSTLAAVTQSLEQLSFNTAIARLMECVNFFTKQTVRPKQSMETLVMMLSPMAPHLADELWQALGHRTSCALERWPEVDADAIRSDTIEVPIQVNGKLRGKVTVAAEADRQALERAALEHEKVVEVLADSELVKTVVVPGRLVNFVVRPRG